MKVNTFSLSKSQFYILHFTFYIIFTLIFLTILSCSSPTSNPKGSLTGFVNLENQFDHSEITVALYDLAELDPDIVYANVTWPHIGVKINQHTEFDHRFQSPIADTQTEADGSFLIPEIPVGKYNLVAKKDGWGFKYLFEVEILEGENLLADKFKIENVKCKIDDSAALGLSEIEKMQKVKNNPQHPTDQQNFHSTHTFDPSSLVFDLKNRTSDLTLYPETTLSGFFPEQSNFFLPDHHYIIEDDTVLLPDQYLEIQPGAVIRINPGIDLTIHGSIKAQGEENNMFWVTSNDGFSDNFKFSILNFTLQSGDSPALYNSMELADLANVVDDLISWGKWSWGNTCLLNRVNNLTMQNGILKNGNCGLLCTSVEMANCIKMNSQFIDNISNASIFYNFGVAGNIKNNIIIYSMNGIRAKNSSRPLIENNYIAKSSIGIVFSHSANPIIMNNEIIATIGLYNEQFSNSVEITWNNITADIGIKYPQNYEIHYNNFKCEDYYILCQASSNPPIYAYVSAENNYYFTSDIQEIEKKIHDNYDIGNGYYSFIVNFIPYENIIIQDAGIKS